jgi:hypothetical protein
MLHSTLPMNRTCVKPSTNAEIVMIRFVPSIWSMSTYFEYGSATRRCMPPSPTMCMRKNVMLKLISVSQKCT